MTNIVEDSASMIEELAADPLVSLVDEQMSKRPLHQEIEPMSEMEMEAYLKSRGVTCDLATYKQRLADTYAQRLNALRVELDSDAEAMTSSFDGRK